MAGGQWFLQCAIAPLLTNAIVGQWQMKHNIQVLPHPLIASVADPNKFLFRFGFGSRNFFFRIQIWIRIQIPIL
jgi:hypothetical protein